MRINGSLEILHTVRLLRDNVCYPSTTSGVIKSKLPIEIVVKFVKWWVYEETLEIIPKVIYENIVLSIQDNPDSPK